MNGAETKHVYEIDAPSGSGVTDNSFKVQKITAGIFEALFDDDFHGVPAVCVPQIYPYPAGSNSNGGDTGDDAVLIAIGADRVRLKTVRAAALLSPHMGA